MRQNAVLWGNGLKQAPWCGDHDAFDTLLLRSWHFYCAVRDLATILGGLNFRVYRDRRLVECGCVIFGLAWSLLTLLALTIEITDICWLFNSTVDFFFKLYIKFVDYFIPGNIELHLLNLPGIKLNNRSEYHEWKTRMPLFITAYYDAGSLMKGWQWFYLLIWSNLTGFEVSCCSFWEININQAKNLQRKWNT